MPRATLGGQLPSSTVRPQLDWIAPSVYRPLMPTGQTLIEKTRVIGRLTSLVLTATAQELSEPRTEFHLHLGEC